MSLFLGGGVVKGGRGNYELFPEERGDSSCRSIWNKSTHKTVTELHKEECWGWMMQASMGSPGLFLQDFLFLHFKQA